MLSAFEAYRFIDCQLIAACGHDSPKVLIPNKDTIEQPCEQVRAGFFADAQQHGMHHLITPRYSYLLPEFYPKKQFIGKVDNMKVYAVVCNEVVRFGRSSLGRSLSRVRPKAL